jgi:hypothetical protein
MLMHDFISAPPTTAQMQENIMGIISSELYIWCEGVVRSATTGNGTEGNV